MRMRNLEDIKINKAFAESVPSEKKMNECRKAWDDFQRQDRYLVVNPAGYLIDGYVQYLVLKEKGVKEAQIKISNRRKRRWYRKNTDGWLCPKYRHQKTTYVYGIHPSDENKKEYIWRVPNSWKNWEEGLLPGDEVFVNTKFGKTKIIITKIEYLNECPVDFGVKKVCRRTNMEEE